MKKFFKISSWTLAGIFLILIALGLTHNVTMQCREGDSKFSFSRCGYQSSQCLEGEDSKIKDNINYCTYTGDGFGNSPIFTTLTFITLTIWVVIVIIYIFSSVNKNKSIDISNLNKEDFVNVDEVKDIIFKKFSKEYGIPHYKDNYDKTAFRTEKKYTYEQNKEKFVKLQFEAIRGTWQGIFTIIASQSRGKKWLEGGNYILSNELFHELKIQRGMPLNAAQSEQERLLQTIASQNPERAYEYLQKTPQPLPIPKQEEKPQQVVIKPPTSRKPYYRPRKSYG